MMLWFMIKHILSLLSHNPQCLYTCVDSIMTDVQTVTMGLSVENNRPHIREQLFACVSEYFNSVGEVATCSCSVATTIVTR